MVLTHSHTNRHCDLIARFLHKIGSHDWNTSIIAWPPLPTFHPPPPTFLIFLPTLLPSPLFETNCGCQLKCGGRHPPRIRVHSGQLTQPLSSWRPGGETSWMLDATMHQSSGSGSGRRKPACLACQPAILQLYDLLI